MSSMNWALISGMALIVAGTALTIWASARPNRIEVSGDSLVIKGNYGLTVRLDDIKSCELVGDMPHITFRTNGIGLPNIKTGHFRADGVGKCRLYINLKYPPFVHVTTISGEHIFFNTKDSTTALFNAISGSMKQPHGGLDPCH